MKYSVFFVFLIFIGCGTSTQLPPTASTAKANSDEVLFVGRVDESSEDFVRTYWPGTAIKFRFKGTEASIELKDEKGENFFNVVIDDGAPFHIDLDSLRTWVTLAQNLPKGEHEIALYKRTEWNKGFVDIFNIKTDGFILKAPKKASRTIEYFGNSISTGYANEDYSGNDEPDGLKTNNYLAYSAITARELNADMHCIAKGGIGIMVSWFPIIMPELYDRLNPWDEDDKWDFGKMTPDIVVINLFQNDSWIIKKPDFVEFKKRFGNTPPTEEEIIEAYRQFLEKIRAVYPTTPILCTLGSMDATKVGSPWPSYIEKAVENMNDSKIHTLIFPFKNSSGHPNPEDHQKMADLLVTKIQEIKDW